MSKISDRIMPYIFADERKLKFIRYSHAESFYMLPYEEMNKSIAIGSKYAIKENSKGNQKGTFYTNNCVYYYKIIDYNTNWFGIIYVEKLENKIERRK